jgi:hypothetical protein
VDHDGGIGDLAVGAVAAYRPGLSAAGGAAVGLDGQPVLGHLNQETMWLGGPGQRCGLVEPGRGAFVELAPGSGDT